MKTFACIFFITLILTAPTGCKSYMKMKYGIAQPREETRESLIAFLEKNHFPTHYLYMFRDSTSYLEAMRHPVIRKNLLSHMLFDTTGNLVERDTARCQWAGSELIRRLRADSSCVTTDQITLGQIARLIAPFGRDSADNILSGKCDFTLVVIWAKFLGTYNYRLFDLEKAAAENKTAVIRLIFLNMDMQKEWQLKPGQQLNIH